MAPLRLHTISSNITRKCVYSDNTVKPLYSERLRDREKCSLYGGVHYLEGRVVGCGKETQL